MKIISTLTAAALLSAVFLLSCAEVPRSEPATTESRETQEPAADPEKALLSAYFLGDSNTAHLANKGYEAISGLVDPMHVWSGGGGTLMLDMTVNAVDPKTNITENAAELAKKNMPEYLIITLGYNGYALCSAGSEKSLDKLFCAAYEKLLNDIRDASPHTKIFIQSIFPVRRGTAISDPERVNARIDDLNAILFDIARENGVIYLDTQSVLRDKNGHLRAEYSESGAIYHADGYHLSDTGLLAVLNYIKEYAFGGKK